MSGKIQERRWEARSPQEPWGDVEVVAAASHPGAANTLLPVVEMLTTEKGAAATLVTAGKINDAIVPAFPFRTQPALTDSEALSLPDPAKDQRRLILASVSSLPDMELELELLHQTTKDDLALDRHTLVAFAEDNTAGLRGLLQELIHRGGPQVDRIFTANNASQRAYPEHEFGIPRDRMVTTGSPTFDGIKREDTLAVNQEVRQALDISLETLVIGYFGMSSQEPHFEGMEFKTTKTVGEAVRVVSSKQSGRDIAFIYRRHPREAAGGREALRALLPPSTKNLRVVPHEESEAISTSHIAAASDVGISLLSTVLTEMALRGARDQVLSPLDLLHPERQTGIMPLYLLNADAINILGTTGYEIPLTAQTGAAVVAWNNDELPPRLEQALLNRRFRDEHSLAQKNALRAEYAFGRSPAAGKIVNELEKLLTGRG